jgi:cytochrome c553
MTAKFVTTLALVVAFGSGSGVAAAAGNAQAGQAKSVTCMACHGADGNSANPEWPNLAGQHPAYIQHQLKGFKAGQRQNPLMTPMAMTLQDQDIDDLAAYFASQALHATGETDPAKLELGQRLYRGGRDTNGGVPACGGCHGPAGAGNPGAAYPRIGGQHATYVAAQLRSYRGGTRTTDPNQTMRTIASKLTDAEIDALAAYVQGLR